MAPFLGAFFDDGIPVRLEFWDGSAIGPTDGPGTVLVRSADAINRLLWAPGELGLARAYVTGDLDMDGDIFEVLRALHDGSPTGPEDGSPRCFTRRAGGTPVGSTPASPGQAGRGSLTPRPTPFQES